MLYLNKIIALISVCFLIFISQYSVLGQVHSIEKTFEVEPGGALRARVSAGTITVRGWEYDEVQIRADVFGSARSLDTMEMRIEKEGNDIVVRTGYAGRRTFHFLRGGGDARVEFTVYVPYRYDIDMKISAGKVDIDDVDGRVSIKLSAGTITVTNVFGEIDASTSAGTINAELIDQPNRVSLRTSTGSISIAVPEEISGRFDLRTSIGRVNASLQNFSGSGTSVKFEYNNGGPLIEARASVGSIDIHSR
jgi:hypothetical protein